MNFLRVIGKIEHMFHNVCVWCTYMKGEWKKIANMARGESYLLVRRLGSRAMCHFVVLFPINGHYI